MLRNISWRSALTAASLLGIILFYSCDPREPLPQTAPAIPQGLRTMEFEVSPEKPAEDALAAPWGSPLLIIKSGDNPLWFDLGSSGTEPEGPFLINGPDEASLVPFVPWTLARRVTELLFLEDRLILGVNRQGFLVILPWEGESLALYRITDPPYWGTYTLGSCFIFQGIPGGILHREFFFTDPLGNPPSPRVLGPLPGIERPAGIGVPAFASLVPEEGWDVDALRQGRDGYWYYRGIQRAGSQWKQVYFRTPDLSLPGEPVSVSVFRDSSMPWPLNQAPPLLEFLLERVFSLSGRDQIPVALICSPDFSVARSFAPAASLTEDRESLVELTGYYCPEEDDRALGLILLPDGQGIFGKTRRDSTIFSFEDISLPPLPEGFSYTRIGLLGKTLIAAWEEQEDMSVGAAGLMILRTSFSFSDGDQ